MGHFVMVSLWYASSSTNTRFRFLYFRMNNSWAYTMLHQEKELPNDSGMPFFNRFTTLRGYCTQASFWTVFAFFSKTTTHW